MIEAAIGEARNRLLRKVAELQNNTGGRASIARCLSTIQKIPCLYRCNHELRQATIEYATIDPIYSTKHDFAKIKMIDAISMRFSPRVRIKSEFDSGFGKLDIALLVNTGDNSSKIRTIGIEIKTGKTIDLFQLERYLYDCDALLVARIAYGDVSLLRASEMYPELQFSINAMIEKADAILSGHSDKIAGQWCRGCSAPCEFRKGAFSSNKIELLGNQVIDLLVNLPIIIQKISSILEKELLVVPSVYIRPETHADDGAISNNAKT